jgi:hypothetical protein
VHANLGSIQERTAVVSREIVEIRTQVEQIEAIAKEFSLLTGVAFRALELAPGQAAPVK